MMQCKAKNKNLAHILEYQTGAVTRSLQMIAGTMYEERISWDLAASSCPMISVAFHVRHWHTSL